MENSTDLVSSMLYSRKATLRKTAGVVGNPSLAAGLLLGYLLVALAIFIWAFWSQRGRLCIFKQSVVLSFSAQRGSPGGVQNVHISLLVLFIMDLLNAVTAAILGIELAASTCGASISCDAVFVAWFLSRCLMVVLHLLCALTSVLVLCRPQLGAKLRWTVAVVVMLMVLYTPFYFFMSRVSIFGLAAVIFGLAFAIVAKCPSATSPSAAAAGKRLIVFVAMFTFFVVYMPSFVLECLITGSMHSVDKYLTVYTNVLFFMNFQLILDGLLCFFILKLPAGEEQHQQQQS